MPGNLKIKVEREELKFYITKAKENFFNYLYYKTNYNFYTTKKVFGIPIFYRRMTREEALALYNKHTFIENVLLLKDSKLASLFIDYSFLLKMTDDKYFYITLNNLKVLLEIANIDIDLKDIDTRYVYNNS